MGIVFFEFQDEQSNKTHKIETWEETDVPPFVGDFVALSIVCRKTNKYVFTRDYLVCSRTLNTFGTVACKVE
jgi:hypothetical protein